MIKAKHALITYIVSLCLVSLAGAANADDASTEKCFGIAKAGMNDCDSSATSCDKSVIDADPNYFLYVPTGMCNKIVGGMVMTGNSSSSSSMGIINTMSPPATTTVPPATTTTMPADMPMSVPATPATTIPTTPATTGGSMGTTGN